MRYTYIEIYDSNIPGNFILGSIRPTFAHDIILTSLHYFEMQACHICYVLWDRLTIAYEQVRYNYRETTVLINLSHVAQ